jgi:hypothetical protein
MLVFKSDTFDITNLVDIKDVEVKDLMLKAN